MYREEIDSKVNNFQNKFSFYFHKKINTERKEVKSQQTHISQINKLQL